MKKVLTYLIDLIPLSLLFCTLTKCCSLKAAQASSHHVSNCQRKSWNKYHIYIIYIYMYIYIYIYISNIQQSTCIRSWHIKIFFSVTSGTLCQHFMWNKICILKKEHKTNFIRKGKYSRTSRKRPPIMSRICGRLQEVVTYQRSEQSGV